MKQLQKRLTYANVMSTIAVFLVLTGTTALAVQKIGTDELRAGAVTTAKIAKQAVRNGKIADDAVTGAKVQESTLGKVPTATFADNATTARSADDATTLGGIAASAFSRQAHSAVDSGAFEAEEPFGGGGTVRSVETTAPQNGYLLMIGSGDVYGNGTTQASSGCLLNLDGSDVSGTRRSAYTSPDLPYTDCTTNAIEPVAAGTHTVNLNFLTIPGGGGVEGASLDVVFIPFAG